MRKSNGKISKILDSLIISTKEVDEEAIISSIIYFQKKYCFEKLRFYESRDLWLFRHRIIK